jgi:hypothetical protein
MVRVHGAIAVVLLWLGRAEPAALPVAFVSDDAQDGVAAFESATTRVVELHLSERVPLVLGVIPCGAGSTPENCTNGTFHLRYRDWQTAAPGLLEMAQHGLTHKEHLAEEPLPVQLAYVARGLAEMMSWGLPGVRPYTFSAPWASANADTVLALEALGFHALAKDSGDCYPSPVLDVFCFSVPLCQLDSGGNRVDGPSCVFRSPDEVVRAVEARRSEGRVFIGYHVQDVLLSWNGPVGATKLAELKAILDRFRAEAAAGRFRLVTMEQYWQRRTAGLDP